MGGHIVEEKVESWNDRITELFNSSWRKSTANEKKETSDGRTVPDFSLRFAVNPCYHADTAINTDLAVWHRADYL